MKIYISRAYTFSRSPIFSHNKIIKAANICRYVQQSAARFQFPIGYEIQNVDTETISNIIIPQYKELNTPLYLSIGKEIKVDLKPNEFLVLPTRYLILMLLQNKGLQIGNGKMIPMIDKSLLKKVDIDIALSAFYFESNDYFKKLTALHNYTNKEGDDINTEIITFNRQMGYMKRDEKLLKDNKNPYTYNEKFEIIEPEMIKLFGNYNNYIRCKEKQSINEYNEYNIFSFVNFLFRKK